MARAAQPPRAGLVIGRKGTKREPKIPEHPIMVRAGEVKLECAAMLERGAKRAEREHKRTGKAGHGLAATWLTAYAQHLKTSAGFDTRLLMPLPPEPRTQPQPGARKRGGRRP